MKKFIVLSITAAFAVGVLFAPADNFAFAAPAPASAKAASVVKKSATGKVKAAAVKRKPAKAAKEVAKKAKSQAKKPKKQAYERLQITAPKDDDTVNMTFTVSGSAWGWFEGNIPVKVYDYNDTLLYDGYITAASGGAKTPVRFSKAITLENAPTTDAGVIEFNDYSEKTSRLVYQRVVPLRFASSVDQRQTVVTVLSPNGGEQYKAGQTMIINWRVTGPVPYDWDKTSRGLPEVAVALYRGKEFIRYIKERSGEGNTAFLRIGSLPAGDNYRIKVSAAGPNDIAQRYFDLSDAPFSIVGKKAPANRRPVINDVRGPGGLKVNEVGTWTIKATDPDGNYLSYIVEWGDGQGMLSERASQSVFSQSGEVTLTHSYATAGDYKIIFLVSDEARAYTKASMGLKVSAKDNDFGETEILSVDAVDFSITQSGKVSAFGVSREGKELVARVTFTQSYSAYRYRLQFRSSTTENIVEGERTVQMVSRDFKQAKVVFRMPWTGSAGQRDLLAIGVEPGKNYGTIAFLYQPGEDTNPQPGGQPSVTVVSPNGGEVYKVGDVMPIEWVTKGLPASAFMSIILANKTSTGYEGWEMNLFADQTILNDGRQDWKVAGVTPREYVIRISVCTDNNPVQDGTPVRCFKADSSDAPFKIKA